MSEYYLYTDINGNVIMHHGVKGMKWGEHLMSNADYQKRLKNSIEKWTKHRV